MMISIAWLENIFLEICNLIGHGGFTAILARFSDSLIISPS